jgi:transcriptional regulator with XRE-family HTH domain
VSTPRVKLVSQAQFPAGRYLKDVRHRLELGVRDVQEASATLAAQENNDEMYISAARLVQIENEHSTPSVFKILTLCAVYGVDFLDLLARYGVRPDKLHVYRQALRQKTTHPVSTAIHNRDTTVTIPIRMDPRFRWEATQLLNRMVALWGEIPAAFLVNFNPRQHICGLVGLEDYTMFPLLRPGALVMVDDDRRRIVNKEWQNEQERPIYFIELRGGYRCAWCQLEESKLTLIPHPMSPVPAQSFNYPGDAEIVGQVVGVAMRIVPVSEANLER